VCWGKKIRLQQGVLMTREEQKIVRSVFEFGEQDSRLSAFNSTSEFEKLVERECVCFGFIGV
jgi:hypothetical protein